MELGAARRHYHAPLTRTAHLGKAPPKIQELAAVIVEGGDCALEAAKPGATCARSRRSGRRFSIAMDTGRKAVSATRSAWAFRRTGASGPPACAPAIPPYWKRACAFTSSRVCGSMISVPRSRNRSSSRRAVASGYARSIANCSSRAEPRCRTRFLVGPWLPRCAPIQGDGGKHAIGTGSGISAVHRLNGARHLVHFRRRRGKDAARAARARQGIGRPRTQSRVKARSRVAGRGIPATRSCEDRRGDDCCGTNGPR